MISVIIPIYNGEKYIEQTINSVLDQPYKDLEILCIDDGSKDSSSEIVKSISDKDNRVKYIYKENGGVHTARNKGIEICSGELATFLDQDDLWAKNSITPDFIKKLKSDKCDFYKCSYFDVNQSITRGRLHELPNDLIKDIKSDKMQHHSSYVFDSNFLKSNDIFTDEYRCEDWRFLMRCYAYANKARTYNNPFFMYRNNTESVSHSGNSIKSIKSSLDGFVKYEKLSKDAYVKESCGIWAIGMVFELIDKVVSTENAEQKVTDIIKEYDLQSLMRKHWHSEINEDKLNQINQNVELYIRKQKKNNSRDRILYSITRNKLLLKIFERKKYSIKVSEFI